MKRRSGAGLLLLGLALSACVTQERIIETMSRDMDEFESLMQRAGLHVDDVLRLNEHDAGARAIERASFKGDVAVVERLLAMGANPQYGLAYACHREQEYDDPELRRRLYRVVQILVAHGARPEAPSRREVDEAQCVALAADPERALAERARVAADARAREEARHAAIVEDLRSRAPTPAPTASWPPPAAAQPAAEVPYCERPEVLACKATGRSCEQCFYDSLPPAPPEEVSCNTQFGEEACGGRCCGKDAVCCVSDTGTGPHCMPRSTGCTGWGRMRKHDWDRGMR